MASYGFVEIGSFDWSPELFMVLSIFLYTAGYAGSRDYAWDSAEDPAHPTKKRTPTHSLRVLCGLLITSNSVHVRTELATRGSESFFQWDMWISVGSSVETAGSLCNPETRRSPSDLPMVSQLYPAGTTF